MSAPYSIRAEMAAAMRAVGARYNQIPAGERPEVSWQAVDDVLERALTEPDREKALAAIEEWKSHWMGLFSAVTR